MSANWWHQPDPSATIVAFESWKCIITSVKCNIEVRTLPNLDTRNLQPRAPVCLESNARLIRLRTSSILSLAYNKGT